MWQSRAWRGREAHGGEGKDVAGGGGARQGREGRGRAGRGREQKDVAGQGKGRGGTWQGMARQGSKGRGVQDLAGQRGMWCGRASQNNMSPRAPKRSIALLPMLQLLLL